MKPASDATSAEPGASSTALRASTDYEWAAIKPFLPNKPRGVPRVNDRRVLNGIFWVLRSCVPGRR
jgi:transposase